METKLGLNLNIPGLKLTAHEKFKSALTFRYSSEISRTQIDVFAKKISVDSLYCDDEY